MTDRPAGVLDPWGTLLTVGKLSLMLGIFSFLRLGTEIVQLFLIRVSLRADRMYLLLVLCDFAPAILWVVSGRMLRDRRPRALAATVMAGGISLVDGLVSAFMMAPMLIGFLIRKEAHEEPIAYGIFTARLLLYVLQIFYSPLALALVLRKYLHPGLPDVYRAVTRRSLWILLFMTILLTLPPQIVLKYAVMNF